MKNKLLRFFGFLIVATLVVACTTAKSNMELAEYQDETLEQPKKEVRLEDNYDAKARVNVGTDYDEFVKQLTETNKEYTNGSIKPSMDLSTISIRLKTNVHYNEALKCKNAADEALNKHDSATVDKYVAKGMTELTKFKANRLADQADALVKVIRRGGMDKKYAENFAQGVELTVQSRDAFKEGNYEKAIYNGEKAVTELRKVYGNMILVNDYTVVRGDCLWKIAAKPDIYNDAYRWPKIYMANRNKFKKAENPNFIYPGQVFAIPRF